MLSRIFRLFGRRDRGLDCDRVRDMASDYLDGESDEQDRSRISAHLDRCSLCRAFVNTLRATVALMGSFTKAKPPPLLKDSIHARIRREAAGPGEG